MNNKLYQALAVTSLCLAGLGAANAESRPPNDALGIADARISLTQAVTAAEQEVGGQAARAEYEREDGRGVFEVEVVKGGEVMDVEVDPSNGKVLSAKSDTPDQGDDEDQDEGSEANEADD